MAEIAAKSTHAVRESALRENVDHGLAFCHKFVPHLTAIDWVKKSSITQVSTVYEIWGLEWAKEMREKQRQEKKDILKGMVKKTYLDQNHTQKF